MSSLRTLNISRNHLYDYGAVAIAELKSPSSLDISGNYLTEMEAEAIAKMPFLLSLNISSNDDLRREKIIELKQNLPGCRVKFLHRKVYSYSRNWDYPVLEF